MKIAFLYLLPLYAILCGCNAFLLVRGYRKIQGQDIWSVLLLVFMLISLGMGNYIGENQKLGWIQREFIREESAARAENLALQAQCGRTTVYSIRSHDEEVGIAAFTKLPVIPVFVSEFVLIGDHDEPFSFTSDWYLGRTRSFALKDTSLTQKEHSWELPFDYLVLTVLGGYAIYRTSVQLKLLFISQAEKRKSTGKEF